MVKNCSEDLQRGAQAIRGPKWTPDIIKYLIKHVENNSFLSKRGPKWIAGMLESLMEPVENYGSLFEREPKLSQKC